MLLPSLSGPGVLLLLPGCCGFAVVAVEDALAPEAAVLGGRQNSSKRSAYLDEARCRWVAEESRDWNWRGLLVGWGVGLR